MMPSTPSQLKFLLLIIMSLAPNMASSMKQSSTLLPKVLEADLNRCGNIPFPFGIVNLTVQDPLPGFGIVCELGNINSTRPMLKLSSGPKLPITNFSIESGTVTVLISAMAWACARSHNSQPTFPSLEGTPYTYSDTQNKLTVLGCDAMVMFNALPHNHTIGCVSFCDITNQISEDSCTGVGCCQASIPKELKSLQNIKIGSLRGMMGVSNRSQSCTEVFLVDQYNFSFSAKKLRDLLSGTGKTARPVVLEWSIGNQTCDKFNASNPSVCKEHSECYNVTGAAGYRCNCSEGYTGNPYIGCDDIDECKTGSHQCVGSCINTNGSYICPCPWGHLGNGRKDGDKCRVPKFLEITVGVGLLLLIIILAGSFLILWGLKKKKIVNTRRKYFMRNGGYLLQQQASLTGPGTRIFSIEELQRATENFSDSRVVGHGGYGTVYKGKLSDQTVVAIKKAKVMDESQIEQFINEVIIVSKIDHPNVVKLFGCCLEAQVPLLVYEFIPNGSLCDHVHNTSSVAWNHRLRIALETARAIVHLHSKASFPIIHRDIKSANILLDKDYTAKVSDFGASRLVPYNQTHVTTMVQGTLGYLDPEYFHTSQLTEKSDVYSFGVVLVELLTSEKPVSFCRSERNLAAHFTMLLKENRLLEVVDYRILKEAGALHVYAVAHLAKRCLNLKGGNRPTMNEVAVELNALKKLMTFYTDQRNQDENFPLGKPLPEENHSAQWYAAESHLLS